MSSQQPSLNILIVDDNVDALTIETALFESAGAVVRKTSSSKEAVTMVAEQIKSGSRFDMIVIDIQMPEMSGYSFAKEARNLGHEGPIIAFTANATMQGKKVSEGAGIDAYFTKTALKRDLVDALLREFCTR